MTLPLKIYTIGGEYIAACKYGEDAIALCQLQGEGANVRYGHAKRNTVYVCPSNPSGIDAEKLWSKVESLFPPGYFRASQE